MVWHLLYARDRIPNTALSLSRTSLISPFKKNLASRKVLSWQLLSIAISHSTTTFRGPLYPGCSKPVIKRVGVPEPGQSCNGKPWPEAPLINPAETFSKLHHSLRLLHPILSLSPLLLPQEPHHKVFPSWIFPLTDMFLRHILQFCLAGSFTECQSWPLTWFWTLTYLGSICFTRVPEFKGLPPKTEWSSSKEICLRHHITSPIPITNAIVVEHSVSVGHSFSSEWWHYHSRNKK